MRFRDRSKKYLVLLPFVVLLASILFYSFATNEIQQTLLRNKINDMVHIIQMIDAGVGATPERPWQSHEASLRNAIEYIDRLPQVFAAVYVHDGDGLRIITERWYETSPLDPLTRPEFWKAIENNDSGSIIIGDTPDFQRYRDNLLYYQWMPDYSPHEERYLVAVAVSDFAIDPAVALWVAIGQLAGIAVSFLLSLWLVIIIIRKGYDSDDIEMRRTGRRA